MKFGFTLFILGLMSSLALAGTGDDLNSTLNCLHSLPKEANPYPTVFEQSGLAIARSSGPGFRLTATDGKHLFTIQDLSAKTAGPSPLHNARKYRVVLNSEGKKQTYCLQMTTSPVGPDTVEQQQVSPPATCAKAPVLSAKALTGAEEQKALQDFQRQLAAGVHGSAAMAKRFGDKPGVSSQGTQTAIDSLHHFRPESCEKIATAHPTLKSDLASIRAFQKAHPGSGQGGGEAGGSGTDGRK